MSPYPQFFFFVYHPSILELIGVITTMIFLIVVIIPFCSHVLFPVAKKYLTNLCHVKKMDVLGNNIKRIINSLFIIFFVTSTIWCFFSIFLDKTAIPTILDFYWNEVRVIIKCDPLTANSIKTNIILFIDFMDYNAYNLLFNHSSFLFWLRSLFCEEDFKYRLYFPSIIFTDNLLNSKYSLFYIILIRVFLAYILGYITVLCIVTFLSVN